MEKDSEYSDLKLLNVNRTDKIYSIEEIAELSKETFEKYDFKKVYIFGSYARGEATKYSDIDIMIVGGNIKGLISFSEFIYELVRKLKKEFDIVTEETYTNDIEYDKNSSLILAKKIFYNEVLKERVLIYG